MRYKKPQTRLQTETKASNTLRKFMEARGWYLVKLHGNVYQSGMPDLYCGHILHGYRWIEMKAPGGKLRPSQMTRFAELREVGIEVYVLESYHHYDRLFKDRGNWLHYVRI